MTERVSFLDYYFVPLGREPGGLLDRLGLPPTASELEVSNRIAQRKLALSDEYKAKRKRLKAQLDYTRLKARLGAGGITQVEFDAEREELVSPLLSKEIVAKRKYEELKAAYEAGELIERKYNSQLENTLWPIGYRELFTQRQNGQITQEELEAQKVVLIAEVEQMQLTTEEVEAQRAAILEELEASEITQEEFDQLDRQWNEERTAAETRLNALKKSYDLMLADRRAQVGKGFAFETTVWRDLSDWQVAATRDPDTLADAAGGDATWLAEATGLADMMLDLLGLPLPSMTTARDVSNRVAQRLLALDYEYRAKRKRLKAQLDYTRLKARLGAGEITQVEFDAGREELVSPLLSKEIVAKRKYEELKAAYEAGELIERKYNYRLKAILAPIGYRDLIAQRQNGQITQEELEAQQAILVASLEQMQLTTEEVEAQRAAVMEELEASEITQEEFDQLDREWNNERTAAKIRLNALRESYDAMLASRRECESQGFAFEATVWRDLSGSEAGSLPDPGWSQEAIDLADRMWSGLDGAHRSFWEQQVKAWSQEVARLGPSFDVTPAGAGERRPPVKPEFPTLSEPYPLAIDRLEREEVEEISLQPVRGDKQHVAFKQLMEALLGELAQKASKQEAAPAAARRPSTPKREVQADAQRDAEEFMRFLQALARLRGEK